MSRQIAPRQELTPSGYAILGLLAIGAHSAYELTQQMQRTLRFIWPRAASKLYEAPKVLASIGLARATQHAVGRRPRTRYTITGQGREALGRWLGTRDIAPLELESEALLRVWFGRFGTVHDLRAAIQNVQKQAQANLKSGTAIGREYLAEGIPPERGHVSALTFRFLWDFNVMLDEWAGWSLRELRDWNDVEPTPARMDRAAGILREALAELRAPSTQTPQ
jgi:PadR family transcriptional regulator, regulatory protein AphA